MLHARSLGSFLHNFVLRIREECLHGGGILGYFRLHYATENVSAQFWWSWSRLWLRLWLRLLRTSSDEFEKPIFVRQWRAVVTRNRSSELEKPTIGKGGPVNDSA
eukprot:COSAG03_NODE_16084_length_412_cov_0.814696_1_plen_104_part_01